MSEERRVARHAGTVAVATLLSRVLGLVREQVMAGLFGAGFATDAFNVAFRIPNLLRDLFAEGAMSSAFVPTFTEVQARKGAEASWAFGRQLLMSLFLLLATLCTVAWLAAPWIVRAFAPGFGEVPGKLALTVHLTRVMLPFLPAVAMAAVCMGMLNANNRFAIPALAPALLNVSMVVFGVSLIPLLERAGQPAILGMAIGVLVGGIAQFLFQLPSLHSLGFSLRLERPRRHPAVLRVATLMVPATIGLAATQLNLFVSTLIASLLRQGSVSWLWYAFRIMQLPIGVFGVALATVSLPALSRAAVDRDLGALKATLSATLRLVFLLTLPAALWLAVMSRPVISLLYEHGRFSGFDTVQTANALVMYCVGLPAFAAVGVLTRTFYALGDTRTPVQASFVSVGLNIVLNLLLMRPMGHLGLAISTSITAIANLSQLLFYLRRRVGPLEGRRLARTVSRVGTASAVVVALLGAALLALGGRWHRGLAVEAAVVAGGFGFALVAGWAMMKLLRVEELHALEDLVRALRARLTGGAR